MDCRRVNILVGANASGKTAILEALFLASGGSPGLVSQFRSWRGVENGFGIASSPDSMFNELFRDFDLNNSIKISLETIPFGKRVLEVKFDKDRQQTILGQISILSPEFMPSSVAFNWSTENGNTEVTPLVNGMGGMHLPSAAPLDKENFFFSATNNYSAAATANRFSELSKNFRHKNVVSIFTSEFPDITDIGVEIYNGIPALAGSIKNISQKLPLSLISGGVNKFATLLCCIENQKNVILFIDEIENGFYYDRLISLWQHLYDLAIKNDAQIFASTHSAECLEAASIVAADHPEDFAVVHMDKDGPRRMQGRQLVFAVEQHLEIR